MEVEDEHPSNQSLTELLCNKLNKIKVVRILYQALISMGYTESAQQLQKESQIYPEQETQSKLKTIFNTKRYPQVLQLTQGLQISSQKKTQIKNIVSELQVLLLINEKTYEKAIELIMSYWPENQDKQLKFLTIIATNQPLKNEEFQERQILILQNCITESFELKKSIDKMLKGYLSSSEYDKRLMQEEQPYRRTIAESDKITNLGKPTFVKFNPKGDLVCLISQTNKQMQASLWMIHGNKINTGLHWRHEGFGAVNNICWNAQGEKIAVCSSTKLGIFDTVQFKPKIILDSRTLLNTKILCCKWNSQGHIYIGGLTDAIGAFNEQGKLVRTIRPFMRTREMIFNQQNEVYTISATKGLLTRFDLKQQKILSSFSSKFCFMDIYLNQKAQTLVVTNKQYIYLLNSNTLEEKYHLISPNNEKMFKIQAFFVNDWLVVFNQKLTAVLQNHSVTKHHLWPDCDAIDIKGTKMITAKGTLMLWQSDCALLSNQQENISSQGENMEEVSWYSQQEHQMEELQQQMHSIQHSDEAESSESEASMEENEQNQIQIEYLENEDNEDQPSQQYDNI